MTIGLLISIYGHGLVLVALVDSGLEGTKDKQENENNLPQGEETVHSNATAREMSMGEGSKPTTIADWRI